MLSKRSTQNSSDSSAFNITNDVMTDFRELLTNIKSYDAELIAVSKTRSADEIMQLYDKGQRHFGENRVQELMSKKDELPSDIQWHVIGQLQKNKVKYIASFVHCIQSVDSLALAEKINNEALKNDRVISILLQIKIATEASKTGYDFETLKGELPQIQELNNIKICGVMGIGTFTSDEDTTIAEFERLTSYFQVLKEEYFESIDSFKEISMGMSSDYRLALKKGSTMVRIGSLLFGPRVY